ncbi:type III secretion apparatus protein OrgA/MxiK [Burkholderia ubonensis]|uniref:type III secretion apparatus protein OrgA/MxiK n=1 Tax=Burkholderia ubonensis TaxID=101571 RepID=UPI00075EA33A|nr:type III secretion apparatus protein OrgA/MxiK [Burkholderia ubonensis]KWK77697.1 hypothetical protein WM15_26825 [Burkholderia ubonensis]
MSPEIVLNVMYAPYGYAHADHRSIDGVELAPMPRQIANQMMIEFYGLATAIDFDMNVDPITALCIDHWTRLPRICFLLGVHRQRSTIVESGGYLRLDPLSRAFLCLPSAFPQTPSKTDGIDEKAITAAGISYISGVLHTLPRSLKQRLPLLFSKQCDTVLFDSLSEDPVKSTDSWNPTLFTFAANYALLDPATAS